MICFCRPQLSELYISKLSLCHDFALHSGDEIALRLLLHQTSVLAVIKVSVFFFMVSTLSSYILASAQTSNCRSLAARCKAWTSVCVYSNSTALSADTGPFDRLVAHPRSPINGKVSRNRQQQSMANKGLPNHRYKAAYEIFPLISFQSHLAFLDFQQ
jgi:hypothetical protein